MGVSDLDDGHAVVAVQFAEELHDLAALVGVEVAGGFVGENEGGLVDEGAGDAEGLLLAAGELGGVEVFFGDVAVGARDLEVFVDGEVVEEVVALEDEAEVLSLEFETLLFVELADGGSRRGCIRLPRPRRGGRGCGGAWIYRSPRGP